jgi:hypothetical protein
MNHRSFERNNRTIFLIEDISKARIRFQNISLILTEAHNISEVLRDRPNPF